MDIKVTKIADGAELALSSFTAARHPAESCGHNGLPLTPNSIAILGQAQVLKALNHDNCCTFLDCVRGKHERIIVVSEYFQNSLLTQIKSGQEMRDILGMAGQVLQGLTFIHDQHMVHTTLEPRNILFTQSGRVKLFETGLGHMTHYGACVEFPIFNPRFTAPEIFVHGSTYEAAKLEMIKELDPESSPDVVESLNAIKEAPKPPYDARCDIWSLGMVVACASLKLSSPWADLKISQLVRKLLSFQEYQGNILERVARENNAVDRLGEMSEEVKTFINACLRVSVDERPTAKALLEMLRLDSVPGSNCNSFPTMGLRSLDLKFKRKTLDELVNEEDEEPIDLLSIQEAYYLWKLAGGDIFGELAKHGLMVTRPPILSLPKLVLLEGHIEGERKERSTLYDPLVIPLSLNQLKTCLTDVSKEDCYPLLMNNIATSKPGIEEVAQIDVMDGTASLPILIKESDVRYQFKRIILYRRLLQSYPYLRPVLLNEAKIDSLPLYRSYIWAALLGIDYDTVAFYEQFDKDTWTPTDRQIEVDIPRCHQYDNLLASPAGHRKFKRILKAWVAANPQYVYWQGLDSLCAPFLYLNFNDEALAFACLSSFIPKYLYGMFQNNNAPVIQEYLAKLSHIQAFHDAELFNHLDSIGFIPDLYAIPWILTMFAHVFPLNNIFHLWDKLLLGNSAFPLCIGLAVLYQMRERLLQAEFNDCILLFSDLPAIDIEKCVKDSIHIFSTTPTSISYRKYGFPAKGVRRRTSSSSSLSSYDVIEEPLNIASITLAQQKAEKIPRLSGWDLLQLLGIEPSSNKVEVLVIDSRSSEEYRLGTLPESVHLPPNQAFDGDNLSATAESQLQGRKGKVVCVVGSLHTEGETIAFAEKLLIHNINRLCVLHNGMEIFRSRSGVLRVPNT
ncbi:hypothetical protein TCAL_10890 [Tigriopus californicus]|uniref:TBC domain-containing protein kinase-like protein n=1 Tax=Tigriopus californicus TaxID=6832 RepID=A0A553NER1_TIGCA|nr:TBC domain-containing protein kinase-like protein [Tigriopus californicus]TRY63905.1 hypothetical protein TCAL_10890 [Tigriopus californicus]